VNLLTFISKIWGIDNKYFLLLLLSVASNPALEPTAPAQPANMSRLENLKYLIFP
jgi:hypothetical protein